MKLIMYTCFLLVMVERTSRRYKQRVVSAADGTHVGHTVTSLFTMLFGFDVVVKLHLLATHGYNPR